VADEETMGPWGANYLVDHHPKLRADAVLIGEPSTPSTVRFGEKGMVWLALTARGQMGHSAYPHHGWNAIFEVAQALAELRLGFPGRNLPLVDKATLEENLGQRARLERMPHLMMSAMWNTGRYMTMMMPPMRSPISSISSGSTSAMTRARRLSRTSS